MIRQYLITRRGVRHSQYEQVVDGRTTGRAFMGPMSAVCPESGVVKPTGNFQLVTYTTGDTILLTDEEARGKFYHMGLSLLLSTDVNTSATVEVGEVDKVGDGEKLSENDGAGDEVVVPENWEDLRAKDRKDLASKIAGEEVTKVGDADDIIREFISSQSSE